MDHYSPLRYPGGKNKLSALIAQICKDNNVDGHYVEPYCGGASVALHLLFNGHVKDITINDYDRSIYAFWHSVLNDTERLCEKIRRTRVDVATWRRQKRVQGNKAVEKDLLKLGFSTFFLNRTNYSGIIDGGIIGGVSQKGDYKIGCRFNKPELIRRIRFIALHRKHIHLTNLDALKLVKKIKKDRNTIFYFDPPYYLKGPSLYMNSYQHADHVSVSKEIKKIKNARWIVSYDNTKEIRMLYRELRKREYKFFHTARTARVGKEVLFFSKNLSITSKINSAVAAFS